MNFHRTWCGVRKTECIVEVAFSYIPQFRSADKDAAKCGEWKVTKCLSRKESKMIISLKILLFGKLRLYMHFFSCLYLAVHLNFHVTGE